jgi:hypothetical protein
MNQIGRLADQRWKEIGHGGLRRARSVQTLAMRKYWPIIAFAVFGALMIIASLIADVHFSDFHVP